MAAVVESSSTKTWATSTGTTITKPTGLAAGDLLLAVLGDEGNDTFSTPAGWTSLGTATTPGTSRKLSSFYKVADAGDAAASDFSFSTGVSSQKAGILLRISDPVTAVIQSAFSTSENDSTPAFTGVTPHNVNSVIIIGTLVNGTTISAIGTYAIANDNPSWTEAGETIETASSGICALAVAYATKPLAAATGNATLAITAGSAEATDSAGVVISITGTTNATAAPTVLGLTLSMPSVTPTADANAAPTVLTLTLSIPTPAAAVSTSDWDNASKSSTSWTPQSKS